MSDPNLDYWRDRAHDAESRVTAALAVIAGYDDIRTTCAVHAEGRQCLLCDIREALAGSGTGEPVLNPPGLKGQDS